MLPPRHGSCARFFPTLAIQRHAPEQHHYRIASFERLFGTASRTESRSVRAAPFTDDPCSFRGGTASARLGGHRRRGCLVLPITRRQPRGRRQRGPDLAWGVAAAHCARRGSWEPLYRCVKKPSETAFWY